MIDSHSHIGIGPEWKNFENTPDILIQRAQEVGVQGILTVACAFEDISDLEKMVQYSSVRGAFGIHPENANSFDKNKLEDILSAHKNLVALGEIGLDYFYSPDDKKQQIQVFEQQIEIASLNKLPIIIHTRDAEEDTFQILKSASKGGLLHSGAVLHCFTGSSDLCAKALELGLYISASGIITFKKAETLREIFKTIPDERLLIETDAPYLAPVPYRGKTNEPAYLIETARQLSAIRNQTLAEIDKITTNNFNKLFKVG